MSLFLKALQVTSATSLEEEPQRPAFINMCALLCCLQLTLLRAVRHGQELQFSRSSLDSSAESGGLATGLVKEGAGAVSNNAVIAADSTYCLLLEHC